MEFVGQAEGEGRLFLFNRVWRTGREGGVRLLHLIESGGRVEGESGQNEFANFRLLLSVCMGRIFWHPDTATPVSGYTRTRNKCIIDAVAQCLQEMQ